MAIPSKVTTNDQVQDGFRKLNETIDNIVTGLTYDNSTKDLILTKLNGDVINTTLNLGLINATNIVTSKLNNWIAPFTATTFNEVYEALFATDYTIDMNLKPNQYFDLTANNASSNNTQNENKYFKINLITRDTDGDSFVLKINSNNGNYSTLYASSTTITSYTLTNNTSYLFTYSLFLNTWYNNVIEKDYTQTITNDNVYALINNYDTYGFQNYSNYSMLLTSAYTNNVRVSYIKQPGKIIINIQNGYITNNNTEIYLPNPTLFPNEIIEILDISKNTSSNNYNYNKKKIMTHDGSSIRILGQQTNNGDTYGLPFVFINEVNSRQYKFISNGENWILIETENTFNKPITFKPKFYSDNSNFTATTLTNNGHSGSYRLNQLVVDYSFYLNCPNGTTSSYSDDFKILLPLAYDSNGDIQHSCSNLTVVSTSSTNTYRCDPNYSNAPYVRFIKTEFPSTTYLSTDDIFNNGAYVLYCDLKYNVLGNNIYTYGSMLHISQDTFIENFPDLIYGP